MGYPMTWKRVVNRNGLNDGDYTKTPYAHSLHANVDSPDEHTAPYLAADVKRYEQAFRLLAGDIRRLERDAVDEQGIANEVARRSGIEVDVVAAVIKAFMEI